LGVAHARKVAAVAALYMGSWNYPYALGLGLGLGISVDAYSVFGGQVVTLLAARRDRDVPGGGLRMK